MTHRILCLNCHQFLYLYDGDFEGPFDYRKFRPAKPDIPLPRPKQEMVCVRCGHVWYGLRSNGSIFVMTDKGMKPNAPTGAAPVRTVKDAFRELGVVLPEIPRDMADGRGDYREN